MTLYSSSSVWNSLLSDSTYSVLLIFVLAKLGHLPISNWDIHYQGRTTPVTFILTDYLNFGIPFLILTFSSLYLPSGRSLRISCSVISLRILTLTMCARIIFCVLVQSVHYFQSLATLTPPSYKPALVSLCVLCISFNIALRLLVIKPSVLQHSSLLIHLLHSLSVYVL